MPSPFPGMDPYLEGYLWPDVHQALATQIRRSLARRLRPRYAVRLAVATVEDERPGTEIGIMYPDVEILHRRQPPMTAPSSPGAAAVAEAAAAIAPSLTVPLPAFQVRMVTVELYDLGDNRLVTSIEILSPYNKREPGLAKFLQKRARLQAAGVHLLDIDLIRRGLRPLPPMPYTDTAPIDNAHYLITLIRAGATSMQIWPVRLPDSLPVVAVPLREPDPDVPLDLSTALAAIYDEAAYDLSIDYGQPPPPPELDGETAAWMEGLLASKPTPPLTADRSA